jgi:outer membrane protein assembly factor BamB
MSDILMDGPRAYAVTLADELVCLDIASGKELWKVSSGVVNDDFIATANPALSSGRVFFGGMDGTVSALDAKSGRMIWKQKLGFRISTSLAVAQDSLYVGTIAGRLYRLATNSGEILSQYALDAVPRGKLVLSRDSVLVTLGSEAIVCLDTDLAKARWTKKAAKEWTSARPYIWGDVVLLADHGTLSASRLADGTDVWTHDFPNVVRGIGSESKILYIGSLQGTVYAYSPARPSNLQ